MVQWLRLCAPNSGGLHSIPVWGTRSYMPQLRVCMLQKSQNATKWHIFLCKSNNINSMVCVDVGNVTVKVERVWNKNLKAVSTDPGSVFVIIVTLLMSLQLSRISVVWHLLSYEDLHACPDSDAVMLSLFPSGKGLYIANASVLVPVNSFPKCCWLFFLISLK